MSEKLRGAVVVVTGASSGIGRATAQEMADRGAKLVLAARDQAALDEVVRLCERRGTEAIAVVTDVRREEQVQSLCDAAVARFGRIDVWINDAAVGLMGRLEDVPTDVIRDVFDTNVMGTIHGTKAALVQLRKQGRGTIITVGSVAGKAVYAQSSVYCASKHAIHALMTALRQELVGTNIEACLVAPATVDTPFFDHSANYTGRQIKAMRPVYRPERVARAIVSCAERPRREVLVGAMPIAMSLMQLLAPWLYERVQPRAISKKHLGRGGAAPTRGALPGPRAPHAVSAGWRAGRADTADPAAMTAAPSIPELAPAV